MSDTPLDSLTGKDASTLNVAQLAERLAMERALREQATAYVRELVDERAAALRTALDLQAAEYERRLDVLNHAHQAAVEAQAKTVPREMFDAYVKEHNAAVEIRQSALTARNDTAVDVLDKRLDELTQWRSGVEGRIIGIAAAIGVAVIVINILLRFL